MRLVYCFHCNHKVEPRDSPYQGDDLDTLETYYCYHCENYTDSFGITARM